MWEVDGLPVHVLVVHALVVLVPTASAVLVAAAWFPRLRRRLGAVLPVLALLALVLTPLTTSAGEWLERRLPPAPLIQKHADLGDELLLWVVLLFLASLVVYVLGRRSDAGNDLPLAVGIGIAVLVTAVAVVATVQTIRIGDSGARAVWTGF